MKTEIYLNTENESLQLLEDLQKARYEIPEDVKVYVNDKWNSLLIEGNYYFVKCGEYLSIENSEYVIFMVRYNDIVSMRIKDK